MSSVDFTKSFNVIRHNIQKNLPNGVSLTDCRNELFVNDMDESDCIEIRGGTSNSKIIKFYRDNKHIGNLYKPDENVFDYNQYEEHENMSLLSKTWNWLATLFDRKDVDDEK